MIIQDNYFGNGKIENIITYQRYKENSDKYQWDGFSDSDIQALCENVSGWLSKNGYGSVSQAINDPAKKDSNLAALVTNYFNTNWQPINV